MSDVLDIVDDLMQESARATHEADPDAVRPNIRMGDIAGALGGVFFYVEEPIHEVEFDCKTNHNSRTIKSNAGVFKRTCNVCEGGGGAPATTTAEVVCVNHCPHCNGVGFALVFRLEECP